MPKKLWYISDDFVNPLNYLRCDLKRTYFTTTTTTSPSTHPSLQIPWRERCMSVSVGGSECLGVKESEKKTREKKETEMKSGRERRRTRAFLVFLTRCHELIQLLYTKKNKWYRQTKTLEAHLNDKLLSLCCEKPSRRNMSWTSLLKISILFFARCSLTLFVFGVCLFARCHCFSLSSIFSLFVSRALFQTSFNGTFNYFSSIYYSFNKFHFSRFFSYFQFVLSFFRSFLFSMIFSPSLSIAFNLAAFTALIE